MVRMDIICGHLNACVCEAQDEDEDKTGVISLHSDLDVICTHSFLICLQNVKRKCVLDISSSQNSIPE